MSSVKIYVVPFRSFSSLESQGPEETAVDEGLFEQPNCTGTYCSTLGDGGVLAGQF